MNILPQSTLRIVRQLTDPLDSGTNYVQAVVRNSTSGDIVATINLTDKTNQRFTGEYTTPPDISGMGYYIDVTTSVYTDDAYTTLNTNYAIEAQTHFIHEQRVHMGGGGADVNYDKVRRIVKEVVEAQEKPKAPIVKDLTPEMRRMEERIKDSVTQAVSSIRFPEQVRPDLDGVVARVNETVENATNMVLMSIEQKEVTPQTDLTPILDAISALPNEQMIVTTQELQAMVTVLQELVNTQQDVDAMRMAAEEFMGKVSPRTITTPKPQKEENTSALRARRLLGI